MIVTIDGPAGAGKSTVARALAERLGFEFLDTGAMYRAVTLAAIQGGVAPDDQDALAGLLARLSITQQGPRTLLDGRDVSGEIRSPEVTAQVRHFADQRRVREFLTRSQRASASGKNIVTEGRDQGTVVFPNAEIKFFLTADDMIRARRRQADFARQGYHASLEEVQAEQRARDDQDSRRALAPLKPASDAIAIDTTALSIEATVAELERRVRQRWADFREQRDEQR